MMQAVASCVFQRVYVLANQKVVKARVSVLKEDEANLIILVEKWEVTPTFFV